jgi:DNA-binding NarL/FixJ family response regulator
VAAPGRADDQHPARPATGPWRDVRPGPWSRAATERVFLVDAHDLTRRGVARVLTDAGLHVVGQAASVAETLARAPSAGADLLVMRAPLTDGDGTRTCARLQARTPGLRWLLLTGEHDPSAAAAALAAGASGCLLTSIRAAALVLAVRTVVAGGTLPPPGTGGVATPRAAGSRAARGDGAERLARLTPRERAVLDAIGDGLTNQQIAQRLQVADKTVKNYTTHLLAKLDVQSRTQAAILLATLRGRGPGSRG